MKIITNLLTLLLTAVLLTTPLLAADYYVDATSGKDSNAGLSSSAPWRTIGKVNESSFSPGDSIHFKCGAVWREQLSLQSSGSHDNPIILTKFGSGPNPHIMATELVTSWIQIENDLYEGRLNDPFIKNHFGARKAVSGGRVSRYWRYIIHQGSNYNPPCQPTNNCVPSSDDMEAGFFFAGYKNPKFYYKTYGGNPENMEVGARPYCISLIGKSYITIDGIDCYGPLGGPENQNNKTGIVLSSCNNIILRNMTIQHMETSAIQVSGSYGIIIENCRIDDSQRGVFFSYSDATASNPNIVTHCIITNTGTVLPDRGDRNAVGILNSDYVYIEDCFIEKQGYYLNQDATPDSAISFATNSHYGIVRRSHINDVACNCINIGESDNIKIYSNIFERWGQCVSSHGSYNGIRIGAGNKPDYPENGSQVQVYNNLFINGNGQVGDYASIKVNNYNCHNLKVKNNIFYNNTNGYELWLNSKSTSGWEIKNNCFFRKAGNIIIGGAIKKYKWDELSIWEASRSYANNNISVDPILVNVSKSNFRLSGNSTCIDTGTPVEISVDFDNQPAPVGNSIDIGPFEYQGDNLTSIPSGLKILQIN